MVKIFFVAGALFMVSCKNEAVVEKQKPTISITMPVANQHYVTGDTIHITGLVSHHIGLEEIPVHMTDMTSNSEFFHNHYSPAGATSFNFDAKYFVSNTTHTSFKVEVEAVDVEGTTAEKEFLIMVN